MIKDKFKKITTKSNIKVLTILFVVVFIILTAVTDISLDPNNFNLGTWFSNTILSVGISLCGMLLGEAVASDSLKSKVNGIYQLAVQEYINIQNQINCLVIYFNDFLIWFKEKETINKQIDYLISFDIKEAKDIVKYLDIDQLEELKIHPIKLENNKVVRVKTEEQINAIRNVLEGKINVKSSRASYYLSAFENHSSSSLLEEGTKIDNRIENYKKVTRVSKIITSICVSILFATITFNELKDTPLIVSITRLTIRLLTFVSCLYCGWQTETEVIKEIAKKVQNKTQILSIFKTSYETGEFNPVDFDEIAKKEFDEYIKLSNKGDGQDDRQ